MIKRKAGSLELDQKRGETNAQKNQKTPQVQVSVRIG